MKKLALFLFIGSSLLFAECTKLQIEELKYMKKEELIQAYKQQKNLIEVNNSSQDALSDLAHRSGQTTISPMFKKDFERLDRDLSCYTQNKDNIRRVLEKDFAVSEDELNKIK